MKGFSVFLNRWLPVALWTGFMLYASTSVGAGDKTAICLRSLLAWIHPDFGLASLREINFFTRKTAHVIQFVVYAILLWRGLKIPPPVTSGIRDAVILILGSSAVLAVLSEGIQLLTPLRSAQIGDIGLDFAGAVLGVALIFAGGAFFSKRSRKAPQTATADERTPESLG